MLRQIACRVCLHNYKWFQSDNKYKHLLVDRFKYLLISACNISSYNLLIFYPLLGTAALKVPRDTGLDPFLAIIIESVLRAAYLSGHNWLSTAV